MSNAFGEQTAALLVLLGSVVRDVGGVMRAAPLLARSPGPAVRDTSGWSERWLEDPVAYGEAERAITQVLKELRPTRKTALSQSILDGLDAKSLGAVGELLARNNLRRLETADDERAKWVRKGLGALTSKLSKEQQS